MKDWIECDTCGKEYKIICHAGDEEEIAHCPFCGSEGSYLFDEEDDDDFE